MGQGASAAQALAPALLHLTKVGQATQQAGPGDKATGRDWTGHRPQRQSSPDAQGGPETEALRSLLEPIRTSPTSPAGVEGTRQPGRARDDGGARRRHPPRHRCWEAPVHPPSPTMEALERRHCLGGNTAAMLCGRGTDWPEAKAPEEAGRGGGRVHSNTHKASLLAEAERRHKPRMRTERASWPRRTAQPRSCTQARPCTLPRRLTPAHMWLHPCGPSEPRAHRANPATAEHRLHTPG